MRSEEFFADPSVLPTHNSQAVESQLHHIPGLSEHFLYSNDDMFIGRPLRPETFFSPGGITRFVEADLRIGIGENHQRRSGFENSARVNRALLKERFGRVTTRHLEHAATPLNRTVIERMEQEFPEEFARTAASPFRAADNISVTNSLYHYYGLLTGAAIQNTDAKALYVDTTTRKGLALLKRLQKRRDQDFFCLNDGSFPEVGPEERAHKVLGFLERLLPAPRALGGGRRGGHSERGGRVIGEVIASSSRSTASRRRFVGTAPDSGNTTPCSASVAALSAADVTESVRPAAIGTTECSTMSSYTCTRLYDWAPSCGRVPRASVVRSCV